MKPNYLVHDDIYVEIRKQGFNGWGGNQRLLNAQLIDRFFEIDQPLPLGQLLELGCGEGHHCRAFSERGYETFGIDISPTAIEWAREKSQSFGISGHYSVGDLTQPNYQFETEFDVVIDGNCLHCIIDDDRSIFLNNVNKALKPNGVFFVSSLCTSEAESYLTYRNGLPYRQITTANELEVELAEAGLKLLSKRVFQRKGHCHITAHAIKAR
ncbi:class I SAM-dependent methyltransferase [Reinekea marinisedimentorum]|uniref:Methyltransferase family protein n=1 Tax=Reinekea marinisedimentorum TaxID=230495 RepID=A0A4R3HZP3_9GAMM|nr:class I SAM-dependent methyltransferase [Reinekea marinisedimentorum]TCS38728.1 methyltransferase family protein [Reinekea marinisedimentorum]